MKMKFLIFIIMALMFVACSKSDKSDKTKVRIAFDQKSIQKIMAMRNAKSSDKNFGLPDPYDVSEFDCWAVFVTYPELPPINSCEEEGTTNQVARPDMVLGLVPFPDGTLEADVLVGHGRLFQIIGFDSELDHCPPLDTNFGNLESSFSSPFIIGETVKDVWPGEQFVNISVSYTPGGSVKVGECVGPAFNFGEMFHPAMDVPGCRLWIDTIKFFSMKTDAATCDGEVFDGNTVGCWLDDRPGSITNFLNTNVASQPTYSATAATDKGMMLFDGANDYFYPMTDTMKPYESGTLFMVFRLGSVGATKTLMGTYGPAFDNKLHVGSTGELSASHGGSNIFISTPVLAAGVNYLATMRWDGTALDLFLDGTYTASGTATATSYTFDYYIGAKNNSGTASEFSDVVLGEILLYDHWLGEYERTKVEDFLKSAWGI
ncbi:MAG: hypothetical protein KAQ98_03425 [Bacteriovoracaceae bacterium]|nr:hypothetical protein [Bacteriovoracaceae bacterium]